jgi:hypothetical protein
MKEVQGSYDDIDRRLAVFLGLGAFLLTSLGCLLMGADMETFLLRGSLAFTVFCLAGFWYARTFTGLVRTELPQAATADPNVTVTTRDAPELPKFEVKAPVVLPAAEASERVKDFQLPDFGGGSEGPGSPALN